MDFFFNHLADVIVFGHILFTVVTNVATGFPLAVRPALGLRRRN
jgi:hypothetical protein